MKKYLIVLAAAVVALASCKPGSGESGSKYTKISFKESALELAIGETTKLKVLYEPTTLDAPVCEWASSDPAIVSVDSNGNIEAKAEGQANITAKCGELSAVCQITVKSIYDMLTWSGFGLFDVNEDSPISEPYEVETRSGVKYTVQTFPGLWYLWDENIQFVNGTGFSGAGFFAEIETAVELVTEGEHKGALWTGDLVFTDASPADSAGVSPAGALTDAEEWYKYITDTTYEGNGSFKGTPVHYMDFDAKDYYYFQGFVKNGWIGEYYEDQTPVYYYQMNITWFNNEEGMYGLKMEQNEEGKWQFVEPATFTSRDEKYYEQLPEEAAAPAATPRNIKEAVNAPARRKGISTEAMKVFKLK